MNAASLKKLMRALDPNDDPTAEPVSPLALLALFVATSVSVFMFLRWRVQPMQDVGHHVAMTAIVTDYSRADSLYPAIYKPFDFLNTNSLLYSIAGVLGKIINPTWAFRLSVASYQLLLPLANLYALRTFGRSSWGAVMAVPLAYNLSYVYGFLNFIFAAPLAVMAIPLFYRMLVKPTKRRTAAVTVVVLLLFLAHVHVFLWIGVLLFGMTLVAVFVSSKRLLFGFPTPKPWLLAGAAAAAVLPAMLLFLRWYLRAKQPAAADELITFAGAEGMDLATFKRAMKTPTQLLIDISPYVDLHAGHEDAWVFVGAGLIGATSAGIARLHTWKRPPVLELACALSFASYFYLPEHVAAQAVIGSRQIGIALWFAPVFFTPVPGRVTWLGRWFAIAGIVWLTSLQLTSWHKYLGKFEAEEAAGLDDVLAAAPPHKKIHYVNMAPESAIFRGRSFWHIDQWYMLDKRGQSDENPALGLMNSIRYRKSYDLHRIEGHGTGWSANMEIWENFDLVIMRKWQPGPADLANANKHGHRVAKSGDWEIWQSHEVKKK